jgi:rSAM/selenodomain-associated transferase 2
MKLSIIIPTLNEEEKLPQLLDVLVPLTYTYDEIIVVDAESSDKTISIAKKYGVKTIVSEKACRAYQMNIGAKHAQGDVFYFVHADVLPPKTFREDVDVLVKKGVDAACYRFEFDKNALMLKFNSWWTRFDFMFCRGGDQTLFVQKNTFNSLDGFDESYTIMEDFDFIKRLRKRFRFAIIQKPVVVSARKYEKNSYLKVNLINLWSYWSFMLGRDPEKIKELYKRRLNF